MVGFRFKRLVPILAMVVIISNPAVFAQPNSAEAVPESQLPVIARGRGLERSAK
jgi:hypothetical protein